MAVDDGVVYVSTRADSTICAFDAHSLPDGLYAATSKEVWVMTPRDKSIRVASSAS